MDDINQYAISQVLGSTMTTTDRPRFGNFGLLGTVGESLRARLTSNKAESALKGGAKFSYAEDAIVVHAFEDVRQGAATDALLWDRDLAEAFAKRSKEMGLDAPGSLLIRRLINVRKNIRRYEKQGITISEATKREQHPSIVPQYAHVIEFVLVKFRYLYGVSIDDILMESSLGKAFEEQAGHLAPGVSPLDLRLGALYIRKNRNLKKSDWEKITNLDMALIDREFTLPRSLVDVQPQSVPETPGILEVSERDRYLYISRNDHLRLAVEQFRTGRAFEIVANRFWTPRLEDITIQVVSGSKVGGVGTGLWERRLIHDRKPVFNWPVHGEDGERAA